MSLFDIFSGKGAEVVRMSTLNLSKFIEISRQMIIASSKDFSAKSAGNPTILRGAEPDILESLISEIENTLLTLQYSPVDIDSDEDERRNPDISMFLRTSRDDRFRLESINEIRQKNGLSLLRHIDCIEDFFYYAWQGTIDRTRNLDKTANGLMVSIFLPAYQKTVMQISHMIHEAANNKNNPKLIQSFFVDQLYENYFDAKYFSLSNEPYWSTTRDEDQRSNEIYRAKKQSESEEAFKMEFLNSQQQWIMNALGKSFPQETKAQVIPRDFATLFAIASENIFSGIKGVVPSTDTSSYDISFETCRSAKFLPFNSFEQIVKVENDKTAQAQRTVVITTMEALLDRFRHAGSELINGNLKDPISERARSNFGNFIERALGDSKLSFFAFVVLSDEDFRILITKIQDDKKTIDPEVSGKSMQTAKTDVANSPGKTLIEEVCIDLIDAEGADIALVYTSEGGVSTVRDKNGGIIFKNHDLQTLIEATRIVLTVHTKQTETDVSGKPLDADIKGLKVFHPRNGKTYHLDFRVSFGPKQEMLSGEGKGMDFFPTYMRITSKKVELPDGKIDYSSTWKTLKQLKFPADFIEASNRVKKYNRAGLVVVGGITGSGKTTYLANDTHEWTAREKDIHLITIEDPVEFVYDLPNVQQNALARVTYPDAPLLLLRAALRQDPDAILFGEIRDKELLGYLIEASSTGHISFATVHTKNVLGTIKRLGRLLSNDQIEFEPAGREKVLEEMIFAVNTSLVRMLCPKCRTKILENELVTMLEEKNVDTEDIEGVIKYYFREGRNSQFFRAKPGNYECKHCVGAGYIGRRPVVEYMELSSKKQKEAANNGDFSSIFSIFGRGLLCASKGEVDVDEIMTIVSAEGGASIIPNEKIDGYEPSNKDTAPIEKEHSLNESIQDASKRIVIPQHSNHSISNSSEKKIELKSETIETMTTIKQEAMPVVTPIVVEKRATLKLSMPTFGITEEKK